MSAPYITLKGSGGPSARCWNSVHNRRQMSKYITLRSTKNDQLQKYTHRSRVGFSKSSFRAAAGWRGSSLADVEKFKIINDRITIWSATGVDQSNTSTLSILQARKKYGWGEYGIDDERDGRERRKRDVIKKKKKEDS